MNNESTDNYIDFGTYSTMGMRDSEELVWTSSLEDFWWVSTITGIKFGTGSGLTNAYSINSDYGRTFTDTGSSCSYVAP